MASPWFMFGRTVIETMKKMAVVVDQQNEGDPEYIDMSPSFEGIAFSAAVDLAIKVELNLVVIQNPFSTQKIRL